MRWAHYGEGGSRTALKVETNRRWGQWRRRGESFSGGRVGHLGQRLYCGGNDFRKSLILRTGGLQVYRDPQGLQSLGPL
jgi:hypothetical protein